MLTVQVRLDPATDDALLRVLTLLARRRCGVLHAVFVSDAEMGCDLLTLEVDALPQLHRNLVAWISALIPVLGVRSM